MKEAKIFPSWFLQSMKNYPKFYIIWNNLCNPSQGKFKRKAKEK